MSFTKNVFSLGGTIFLSRISGMLRDITMAGVLGTGIYADAFVLAWRLPSILRSVFADGSYRLVIPILSRKLAVSDASMRQTARLLLSWLLAITFIITIIFEIFMPHFILLIAPGLVKNPDALDAAVVTARIIFPYLPLITMAMFLANLRNLRRKFVLTGLMQIIFNLVLISVMLTMFLFDLLDSSIMLGISYSILFVGVLQILIVAILLAKEGLLLFPVFPRWNIEVKNYITKLVPVTLQSLLVYGVIITDTYIISPVSGAISSYHYAERFIQLPLGIAAFSLSIVLLPELSRFVASGNQQAIDKKSNHSLLLSLFFIMPAFMILCILSDDIIQIIYARGSFSPESVEQSSRILFGLSFCLPFLACEPIFLQNCYARSAIFLPLLISLFSFFVNLLGDILLFPIYGVMGVAFATGIASFIRLLLYILIFRHNSFFRLSSIDFKLVGILLFSSFFMGLWIYFLNVFVFSDWWRESFFALLLQFSLTIVIGSVFYILLIFYFGNLRFLRSDNYSDNY